MLQSKNQKSAAFAWCWSFFGKIAGAPPFLGCISLQWPRRSTQNYKREVFKKHMFGRDIGAFMQVFCRGQNQWKRSIFRARICKIGLFANRFNIISYLKIVEFSLPPNWFIRSSLRPSKLFRLCLFFFPLMRRAFLLCTACQIGREQRQNNASAFA